jgi:hypothetical protein
MHGQDPYSKPEKYGLEIIGSIDWDMTSYSFDMTVVWRDSETQQLFYADDSGCSCPSPFEDFSSKEQLTEVSKAELHEHLLKREEAASWNGCAFDIANLMGRLI